MSVDQLLPLLSSSGDELRNPRHFLEVSSRNGRLEIRMTSLHPFLQFPRRNGARNLPADTASQLDLLVDSPWMDQHPTLPLRVAEPRGVSPPLPLRRRTDAFCLCQTLSMNWEQSVMRFSTGGT